MQEEDYLPNPSTMMTVDHYCQMICHLLLDENGIVMMTLTVHLHQEDLDHLFAEMTMSSHRWLFDLSQKSLGILMAARAIDQSTMTQVRILTTHRAVTLRIRGTLLFVPNPFLKARVIMMTVPPLHNPISKDNLVVMILQTTRACLSSAALLIRLSKLEVLGVAVTKP